MSTRAIQKNSSSELAGFVRLNEGIKGVVLIAFQINIMALNAILLAHRAGELGRLNEELEARVAQRTALLSALIETLPYPIFVKGEDTRFTLCNQAYEQVQHDAYGQIVLCNTHGFIDQRLFRMSGLADFEALPEGPPDYEFDGGKLIAMPRPHPRHQRIIMRLGAALDEYISKNALGSIWPEVDVQLSRHRVYVHDLIYLAQEHQERYSEARGRIVGTPDLAVEIVSPASASRDRVVKFNAYREAGVPWYWLVDGETLVIEEFRLMPEGYLAVARVAAGEAFRPQLFPELEIDLASLIGEPAESVVEPEGE